MPDMQDKDQSVIKERLVRLLDYVAHHSASVSRLQYELPSKNYSASSLRQVKGLHLLSSDWLFKIERQTPPEPFVIDDGLHGCFQRDESNHPWPDQAAIDSLTLQPVRAPLLWVPCSRLKPVLAQVLDLNLRLPAVLEQWQHWRMQSVATLDSILLYDRLFAWANTMMMGGFADGSELVAGFGLIQWLLPCKKTYRYPLITLPLEFSIDAQGAIYVGLKPVRPVLEMQAFLSDEGISQSGSVRDGLIQLYPNLGEYLDFFNPEAYSQILEWFVSRIHAKGCMASQVDERALADYPVAVAESFIYMRPHTSNVLTDDIQALKQDMMRPERQLSGHITALVSELSDDVGQSDHPVVYRGRSGTYGEGDEVKDLYFPLPHNSEQVLIAKKLENSKGVVVRGAAGTGKTHTIANIVSDCLARGQKVLITAQQAHVLHTLCEKLPQEIRALAISRTGTSQESKRQLDSSIEHIVERLSHMNEFEVERQIHDLLSLINRTHLAMQQIDAQISQFAQGQYALIDYKQQRHNVVDLLDHIQEGAQLYSWFEDVTLPLGPEGDFPLAPPMMTALLDARKDLGADLPHYALGPLPTAAQLFSEAELTRIVQNLQDYAQVSEILAASPFQWQPHYPEDHLSVLSQTTSEAVVEVGALTALPKFDADVFFQACHAEALEMELLKELVLSKELGDLVEYRKELLRKPVDVGEMVSLEHPVFAAILRGAKTGQPVAWYNLNTALRKRMMEIRVAGSIPRSAPDWQAVEIHVRQQNAYQAIASRWNQVAQKTGLSILPLNLPLEQGLEKLSNYVAYFYRASQFYLRDLGEIRLRCTGSFSGVLPDLSDPRNLEILNAYMHSLLSQNRLKTIRADYLESLQSLQDMQYYKSEAIFACLKNIADLHKPSAALHSYLSILPTIERMRESYDEYLLVCEASGYFEQLGAKQLAYDLLNVPVLDLLGDPVLKDNLIDAWNWKRIEAYVKSISDVRRFEEWMQERKNHEANLSKAYIDLVANSSWLALKKNASEKILVALNRYKISVQKIGKGKGKNAVRYRKDAQEALQQITKVIPCWVMSQQQVSETMPAELEMFDLVIVDEASQSSVEALPVIMRGKKLLVVGDNKQVSPSNVGLSVEQIGILRDKYLHGQPHKEYLTPDMSLYDTASSIYQSGVMLLEHFRCHPDIIAYSNQHFYADRIKPMRVPKQSELLTPALLPIHVPDGVRETKGTKHINRREAAVIIEELGHLLSTPQYKGRTIGVISLLGAAQAEFIQAAALDAYGAEALLAVNFACGEASSFQGAERDIMFLSMVADPEHCSPLSSLAHEQRFNVAASRARDRMYLVTSVLAKDLSSKDLRQGLLSHFFDRKAKVGNDQPAATFAFCESTFEMDVMHELLIRGYRVRPKVVVGHYRIDLVVESADHRLAIECDGDQSYEQWCHDLRKQRDLERAGWVFVRCFAVAWASDNKAAVRDLISALHAMDIHPEKAKIRSGQAELPDPTSIVPFNPKALAAMLNAGIPLQSGMTGKRQNARLQLINWKLRTSPEKFIEENISVFGNPFNS